MDAKLTKKICKICESEIVNPPGKAKKTRYCSDECALIGLRKLQKFWRKAHRNYY